MELLIKKHEVSCIIGVWAHERTKAQRVGMDVRLEFDGEKAGTSDRLEDTINYAQLADTASFILKHGQFQLLESAVRVLVRYFLLPSRTDAARLSATTAEVELTKFDALPGHTLASIRLGESLDALEFSHETPHWGRVDIVAETSDLGLYCLNIAPGQTLPLHQHKVMSESEYIMDDGLTLITLNDEPRLLTIGETFTWPHGFVHGYRNSSDRWCRVLCIDSPPFIPEDEVLWSTK